jgi:hypothetical protein
MEMTMKRSHSVTNQKKIIIKTDILSKISLGYTIPWVDLCITILVTVVY